MEVKNSTFDCGLKSVSEILRTDFKYKVPAHQRNFDWSQEVEQLWEDIIRSMQEKSERYFLGTIVVTQNTQRKERIIIDGQQRLATLSIIFSAIRTIYEKNGEIQRAAGIDQDYLGSANRRTQIKEPRLTLNELNNPYFYNYVNQATTTDKIKTALRERTLHPSNKTLLNAVRKIHETVSKYAIQGNNVVEVLCDLEDFIKDSIKLILWAVSDEADAYVLFETLNDRGLELGPVDLLKNYIFSKAGSQLDHVRQQWNEMTYRLGTQNPTQFLRHFWLSKYGVVREKELFRELRKKFRTQKEVTSLASDIFRASDLYVATFNAEHENWKTYPSQAIDNLRVLNMFKAVQFRPLLLAALEARLKYVEIVKLIDMIVVVTMRYNVIGSLNPNLIEREYSHCSQKIRRKDLTKTSKIFEYLRSKGVYPDDKAFASTFSGTVMKRGKEPVARYILAELVKQIERNKFPSIIEDEKKVTLEHIMPSNHTASWLKAASSVEEYVDNVNRIGNLTLLEQEGQKHAGRKTFENKKKIYRNSHIIITKQLAKLTKWDIDQINKRQERLSKIAIKAWRFPRT